MSASLTLTLALSAPLDSIKKSVLRKGKAAASARIQSSELRRQMRPGCPDRYILSL